MPDLMSREKQDEYPLLICNDFYNIFKIEGIIGDSLYLLVYDRLISGIMIIFCLSDLYFPMV